MLKLLSCLICTFLVAGLLLHLRHERMEINYRLNQAHRRLQDLQTELWNQQLEMAIATAPAAVQKAVGAHRLSLVPARQASGPAPAAHAAPSTPVPQAEADAAE